MASDALHIVSGMGLRSRHNIPCFFFAGGDLVPCDDVGTTAIMSDGTRLEPFEWGDGPIICTYLPEPRQGKRLPPRWRDKIDAKVKEVQASLSCDRCGRAGHEHKRCQEKRFAKLWPGRPLLKGKIRLDDGIIELEMPLDERGQALVAELIQICTGTKIPNT